MIHPPNISQTSQFMLGEMYSDIKWLRVSEEARQKTDEDHEARLSSLEHFKFKLVFIVGAVGATVSFLFSNVKEGIVWLKEVMA